MTGTRGWSAGSSQSHESLVASVAGKTATSPPFSPELSVSHEGGRRSTTNRNNRGGGGGLGGTSSSLESSGKKFSAYSRGSMGSPKSLFPAIVSEDGIVGGNSTTGSGKFSYAKGRDSSNIPAAIGMRGTSPASAEKYDTKKFFELRNEFLALLNEDADDDKRGRRRKVKSVTPTVFSPILDHSAAHHENLSDNETITTESFGNNNNKKRVDRRRKRSNNFLAAYQHQKDSPSTSSLYGLLSPARIGEILYAKSSGGVRAASPLYKDLRHFHYDNTGHKVYGEGRSPTHWSSSAAGINVSARSLLPKKESRSPSPDRRGQMETESANSIFHRGGTTESEIVRAARELVRKRDEETMERVSGVGEEEEEEEEEREANSRPMTQQERQEVIDNMMRGIATNTTTTTSTDYSRRKGITATTTSAADFRSIDGSPASRNQAIPKGGALGKALRSSRSIKQFQTAADVMEHLLEVQEELNYQQAMTSKKTATPRVDREVSVNNVEVRGGAISAPLLRHETEEVIVRTVFGVGGGRHSSLLLDNKVEGSSAAYGDSTVADMHRLDEESLRLGSGIGDSESGSKSLNNTMGTREGEIGNGAAHNNNGINDAERSNNSSRNGTAGVVELGTSNSRIISTTASSGGGGGAAASPIYSVVIDGETVDPAATSLSAVLGGGIGPAGLKGGKRSPSPRRGAGGGGGAAVAENATAVAAGRVLYSLGEVKGSGLNQNGSPTATTLVTIQDDMPFGRKVFSKSTPPSSSRSKSKKRHGSVSKSPASMNSNRYRLGKHDEDEDDDDDGEGIGFHLPSPKFEFPPPRSRKVEVPNVSMLRADFGSKPLAKMTVVEEVVDNPDYHHNHHQSSGWNGNGDDNDEEDANRHRLRGSAAAAANRVQHVRRKVLSAQELLEEIEKSEINEEAVSSVFPSSHWESGVHARSPLIEARTAKDWGCFDEWKVRLTKILDKRHESEEESMRDHMYKEQLRINALTKWLVKHGKFRRAVVDDRTLAEFKNIFRFLDADNGGSVSVDEMYKAMKILRINLSKAEIAQIMKPLDEDGSGELDFNTFTRLMTRPEILAAAESKGVSHFLDHFPMLVRAYSMRRDIAHLIFRVVDTDDGGSLSFSEIYTAFCQLGLDITENELRQGMGPGVEEIDFEAFLELLQFISDRRSGKLVVANERIHTPSVASRRRYHA